MDEVLYRKYRPQTLDELYGQKHIKRILGQSLTHNKVSHAYLFSGPRGSGKTTVARILSRELTIGGVDVNEIDAASHRGIDDVRNLRESLQYQPTQGDRKMYILDEVHMLTNEAFNALLKSLEEPPQHVYFVLCTTQPHKVPSTIISRCMHLPFQKATGAELSQYIAEHATKEGVNLSTETVELMARHADGAYRDALVLLEKVIGLGVEGIVRPIDVEYALGLMGETLAGELFNDIVLLDSKSFYSKVTEYSNGGGNVPYIMNMMIEHTQRSIMFETTDSGSDGQLSQKSLEILLWELLEAQKLLPHVQNPVVVFVASVMNYMNKVKKLGIRMETNDQVKKSDDLSKHEEIGIQEHDIVEPVSTSSEKQLSEWEQILMSIKSRNKTAEALLKSAQLKSITSDTVIIKFSFEFHKTKVESLEIRKIVEDSCMEVLGRKVSISCVLAEQSTRTIANPLDDKGPSIAFMSPDSLLAQAHEVFGGQMIE